MPLFFTIYVFESQTVNCPDEQRVWFSGQECFSIDLSVVRFLGQSKTTLLLFSGAQVCLGRPEICACMLGKTMARGPPISPLRHLHVMFSCLWNFPPHFMWSVTVLSRAGDICCLGVFTSEPEPRRSAAHASCRICLQLTYAWLISQVCELLLACCLCCAFS